MNIEKIHNLALDYIGNHYSIDSKSEISSFWKREFLNWGKFEDLNILGKFRSFEYRVPGMGNGNAKSISEEHEWHNLSVNRAIRTVPIEFINRLDEPDIGHPVKLKHNVLKPFSASFILNTTISYLVKNSVDRWIDHKKKIDVCEIGPGWGQAAQQIMQCMNVGNYTFIELPKNLIQNIYFICSFFRSRSFVFVENNLDFSKYDLVLSLPNKINFIDMKYDLIFNAHSFQEMSIKNVKSYIEWIKHHLKRDGIFISVNVHGNKYEFKKHSAFGFLDFEILSISPSMRGYVGNRQSKIIMKLPKKINLSEDEFNRITESIRIGKEEYYLCPCNDVSERTL